MKIAGRGFDHNRGIAINMPTLAAIAVTIDHKSETANCRFNLAAAPFIRAAGAH